MENTDIINLWKSYDKKLEESLILNRQTVEDITRIKIQSFITSMKPIKVITLLVGIVWVGLGGMVLTHLFINAFAESSRFFLFSAGIQVLLTAIAIIIYLYQLILIYQVDICEPILATHAKLAGLKSSTLWVTRILFLQLPVWTTFWWNETMFSDWNLFQWAMIVIVTISFTYVAIWLFFNIKFENRDKKWFKLIFNGKEWTPLIKSMELCREIEEFKQSE